MQISAVNSVTLPTSDSAVHFPKFTRIRFDPCSDVTDNFWRSAIFYEPHDECGSCRTTTLRGQLNATHCRCTFGTPCTANVAVELHWLTTTKSHRNRRIDDHGMTVPEMVWCINLWIEWFTHQLIEFTQCFLKVLSFCQLLNSVDNSCGCPLVDLSFQKAPTILTYKVRSDSSNLRTTKFFESAKTHTYENENYDHLMRIKHVAYRRHHGCGCKTCLFPMRCNHPISGCTAGDGCAVQARFP